MSCKTYSNIEAYKIALRSAKKALRNSYFKNAKINFVQLAKYVLAIAKVESKLNNCADNANSTAYGIMQILTNTRNAIETMLKIPKTSSQTALQSADYSMYLACAYLAYQYKRYNNWSKAIVAYNQGNAGDAAMKKGSGYLAKVMTEYKGTDFALLDTQAGSDLAYNDVQFSPEFP